MARVPISSVLLLMFWSWCGASAQDKAESNRVILVELFTSQGCDMCPEAERNLGSLEGNPRIIPIAFHVDYFNSPWHDPFSDILYSKRQAAYNSLYTKPKNAEYGLYYTPMIMVNGVQSENGRDPAGIQRAIRQALTNTPAVALLAKLDVNEERKSGEVNIQVSAIESRAEGRDILVCAVLRDDRISTDVRSGENANKTLNARFPARSTLFEVSKLAAGKAATHKFAFKIPTGLTTDRLGVVVFAQDQKSGEILQATYLPWSPSASPTASREKARSKTKR